MHKHKQMIEKKKKNRLPPNQTTSSLLNGSYTPRLAPASKSRLMISSPILINAYCG